MIIDLRVRAWLEEAGVACDEVLEERLAVLCAAIERFNPLYSLVSQGDLAHVWERHVLDSLSLAPWVARAIRDGGLRDIGSGAGFPGLILASAFPEAAVCLVERSESKVNFLHNVRVAMGLERVHIVCGAFPRPVGLGEEGVITARAVEKAPAVARAILNELPEGVEYLCQNEEGAAADPHMFHVEQIQDEWSHAGLRRSCLFLIYRKGVA